MDNSQQDTGSDWWVYSTAVGERAIFVENRTTKQRATVLHPSPKEWSAAFRAPSSPYKWMDVSRLLVDPTT